MEAAAREAGIAAGQFARRGQANEWAVSRLMADRYTQQLNEEKRSCEAKVRTR